MPQSIDPERVDNKVGVHRSPWRGEIEEISWMDWGQVGSELEGSGWGWMDGEN